MLSLVLSVLSIDSSLIPPVRSRQHATAECSAGWRASQDSKAKDFSVRRSIQSVDCTTRQFLLLAARSSKRVPLKRHLRSSSVLRCLRRAVRTVAEDCVRQSIIWLQTAFIPGLAACVMLVAVAENCVLHLLRA
jgi:hypothetical protein